MTRKNAITKRTRLESEQVLAEQEVMSARRRENEPDSNPIPQPPRPASRNLTQPPPFTRGDEGGSPSTIDHRPSTIFFGWLVAFACAAALYGLTANRGAQWQDSGQHIYRVVAKEPVNPLGLALSHPLHHYLARAAVWFDLVEPCFAVTLVSAFAAALAVANTYGCVATLTRTWFPAAFAAVSLALAHTFWQMATRAETYTLAAALLSAELWCLAVFLRSYRPALLCAAFLFNGLGVSNHLLAALTTPILVAVLVWAVVRQRMTVKVVAVAFSLWLLGALPYVALVVGEWMHTGDSVGTLRSAFFGHGFADEVLNTSISARTTLTGLAFITLNFPNLILPLAAYGAAKSASPRRILFPLLAGLAVHAVFVFRYPIVDQYMFFVPMYVFLVVLGGLGVAQVRRRTLLAAAAVLVAWTPAFYATLPGVARKCQVLSQVERRRPYRDDYVYVFTPWSVVEHSAERMSRQAVQLAGGDGLIVAQRGEYAVRYQVLHLGAVGVQVRDRLDDEELIAVFQHHRAVVLVPDDVANPPAAPLSYYWKPVGDLFMMAK